MNHTHAALMIGGWWVVGGLASGGSADTHKINTLFTRTHAGTTRAAPTWCPPSDDGDRGGGTTCDPLGRAGVLARLSEWTWKRNGGGRRGRAVGCARDTHVAAGCGNGKNYTQTPVTGFLPFNLSVRLFTTTVRARKRRSLTIAIRGMVEVLRTSLFPAQK